MTQALALRAMLARAGHEVGGVLVGRSAQRRVPRFFLDGIGAPVRFFRSPNFVADGQTRAVRLAPTVAHNARHTWAFAESLRTMDEAFEEVRPDVVVNFYEPLAGLYYRRRRPRTPMVCIGHQYLIGHPAFPWAPGRRVDRWALRRFTHLTAYGAARRLALSFYPLGQEGTEDLRVVPPLLRPALKEQLVGRDDGFLLGYVLNSGYADGFLRWHEKNPAVPLHLFWDRDDAPDIQRVDETLTLHRLDGERFLRLMARCSGLACTAGFESVCEAMYLSKPALVVPVEGHYEQACNALDATFAGAGRACSHFDLDRLLELMRTHRPPTSRFRAWADQAGAMIVGEIEAAADRASTPVARPLGRSRSLEVAT